MVPVLASHPLSPMAFLPLSHTELKPRPIAPACFPLEPPAVIVPAVTNTSSFSPSNTVSSRDSLGSSSMHVSQAFSPTSQKSHGRKRSKTLTPDELTPVTEGTGRGWTKEDDQKLRAAVAAIGPRNWKRISEDFFDGVHSDTQCLNRWYKVLRPGLVKGPWTPEEDAIIVNCMSQGIVKWAEIAERIPGRLGKQCRERWLNHLDPSINKGEWSAEEDDVLMKAQAKWGNSWTKIAELLPGRTENAVKNRWNSAQHTRARKARMSEVALPEWDLGFEEKTVGKFCQQFQDGDSLVDFIPSVMSKLQHGSNIYAHVDCVHVSRLHKRLRDFLEREAVACQYDSAIHRAVFKKQYKATGSRSSNKNRTLKAVGVKGLAPSKNKPSVHENSAANAIRPAAAKNARGNARRNVTAHQHLTVEIKAKKTSNLEDVSGGRKRSRLEDGDDDIESTCERKDMMDVDGLRHHEGEDDDESVDDEEALAVMEGMVQMRHQQLTHLPQPTLPRPLTGGSEHEEMDEDSTTSSISTLTDGDEGSDNRRLHPVRTCRRRHRSTSTSNRTKKQSSPTPVSPQYIATGLTSLSLAVTASKPAAMEPQVAVPTQNKDMQCAGMDPLHLLTTACAAAPVCPLGASAIPPPASSSVAAAGTAMPPGHAHTHVPANNFTMSMPNLQQQQQHTTTVGNGTSNAVRCVISLLFTAMRCETNSERRQLIQDALFAATVSHPPMVNFIEGVLGSAASMLDLNCSSDREFLLESILTATKRGVFQVWHA